MEVEISKDELAQFLKDRWFTEWQIWFIFENIERFELIEDNDWLTQILKNKGFSMFQIRYLLKIFSV